MNLEDIKGNGKSKAILISWLDEFFHSKNNNTKMFAVIIGRTGNGKTSLVQALAEEYNVDLYRITVEDIFSSKDFNTCIKCLNLEKLEGKNAKIILFDDFYELPFKSKIVSLCQEKICKYPIILTMDKYPEEEELRNGLIVKLKKPLTSDLVELLKENQKELNVNYSEKELYQIAVKSPSVRSAINSLFTGVAIERDNPKPSLLDKRNLIVQRALNKDLNRYPNEPYLLSSLTKNMNCFNGSGFKVLKRFAIFDYYITTKYLAIDKFLVNNMLEPIEEVKWFKFKKKEKPKQKKVKVKKKVKKKVKEEPKPRLVPLVDFE